MPEGVAEGAMHDAVSSEIAVEVSQREQKEQEGQDVIATRRCQGRRE